MVRNVIKQAGMDIFFRSARMLAGFNKNKVFFESFIGKSYSDNPKPISEYLHSVRPDIEIVWAFQSPESKKGIVPDYVRTVDRNDRVAYYKEVATSSVWVNNGVYPFIPKSNKQMFIQTWHGDRTFKKVLFDSPFAGNLELAETKPGFCDIAIAGSEYGKKQYLTAFHYLGEILLTGTPRNDCLVNYNKDEATLIKNKIGLDPSKKILLYAPTLRRKNQGGKGEQQIQDVDLDHTLNLLQINMGGDWICLLRAHPTVSGLSGIEYCETKVDVSGYEDMADLLLISDCLLTDYSSCAGDYAILNRPVLLYQSDRQQYIEEDRTFYFDIDQSPFWVAKSQDELDRIIESLTDERINNNCANILKFYETVETGHSTQDIVNRIIKHIASL